MTARPGPTRRHWLRQVWGWAWVSSWGYVWADTPHVADRFIATAAGTATPTAPLLWDARPALRDAHALERWIDAALRPLGSTLRWLILGEQHDADAHQALQAAVVRALGAQGRLAALALEMAEAGAATTEHDRTADENRVRAALRWNEAGWPWLRYGPVVMAAVRAAVPVLGANLPRSEHGAVMRDERWDAQLPPDAWAALQERIVGAHCGQIRSAQAAPMARIQVARDARMAHTLAQLAARLPPGVIVLITGVEHAWRDRGVPLHLARQVGEDAARQALRVVELRATDGDASAEADPWPKADTTWLTPAVPPVDHCARWRGA